MTVTRSCPTCGFTNTYTSDALAAASHPRHSCAKHRRRAETARRRAQRDAAGPRRDCRHPGAPHTHGERAAYVRDRCRCPRCRAANTAASNTHHRQCTFGRWSPFLDATPVREHIQMLRAAGIGLNQIAKLAGLSPGHVRGFVHPDRAGKAPFARVRPETAQRLLRVSPSVASRAPASHVDATGTRRRLQALVTIGWPQSWLAHELGRSATNLRRSMNGESVTVATARQVSELYERLWDTAPVGTTRMDHAAIDAARTNAIARGWLPPLAWDDIDADPAPDPKPKAKPKQAPDAEPDAEDMDEIAIDRAVAGDTTVTLTHAEEIEVVRRLSERGRSIRDIANQLCTTTRTVSRHRKQSSAA